MLHFNILKLFCHRLSPFDGILFIKSFIYFTEYAHMLRHKCSNHNNPSSLPSFIPPPSPHVSISRSMCLSCCLWCVCSLIWLDSSCAAREPSWFPVWPAADWWGCYTCLCLSGCGYIIGRFSVFFLLCGLSASLCSSRGNSAVCDTLRASCFLIWCVPRWTSLLEKDTTWQINQTMYSLLWSQ